MDNFDEDELLLKAMEESLRHFHEVELPSRKETSCEQKNDNGATNPETNGPHSNKESNARKISSPVSCANSKPGTSSNFWQPSIGSTKLSKSPPLVLDAQPGPSSEDTKPAPESSRTKQGNSKTHEFFLPSFSKGLQNKVKPSTSSWKEPRQQTLWPEVQKWRGEVTVIEPTPPQIEEKQSSSEPAQILSDGGALTEHGFCMFTGRHWVYPTNYPERKYQLDMVQTALFSNTLVCLPTGLGKTFIAAVVMYNFYRWFPVGKIIFMAPTKPLVAQQIRACYDITGIPRAHTEELTGQTSAEKRSAAWRKKRVFFATPQVVANDLLSQVCPVNTVCCLVVDEAHRATKNYSYCQVLKTLSTFNSHFRVLALSATPGSDLNTVKEVLQNLHISSLKIATEDSPDVKKYTHHREVEVIKVSPTTELNQIREQFLVLMDKYWKPLIENSVVSGYNTTNLTLFQVKTSMDRFLRNPPPGMSASTISWVQGMCLVCMSMSHAHELLQNYGLRTFLSYLQGILRDKEGSKLVVGYLGKDTELISLMESLEAKLTTQVTKNGPKVLFGHPKMQKLQEIVVEHFLNSEDEKTRAMVFCQYRESVVEIVNLLKTMEPIVMPMSFVGQNKSKGLGGFTQKQQLQVMREFRSGSYNTLVSTCVGEEGLDIGEVDLIVCVDASNSPIRLVQRMGRTGRKRSGRIVMLLSEGREYKKYLDSKSKQSSISKAIVNNQKLVPILSQSKSPRMVPQGLNPSIYRMALTIPPEIKTQDIKKITGRITNNTTAEVTSPFPSPQELMEWDGHVPTFEHPPSTSIQCSFLTLDEVLKSLTVTEEPNRDENEEKLLKWLEWQRNLQGPNEAHHSSDTGALVELLQLADCMSLDNPLLLTQTAGLASQVDCSSLLQDKRRKIRERAKKGRPPKRGDIAWCLQQQQKRAIHPVEPLSEEEKDVFAIPAVPVRSILAKKSKLDDDVCQLVDDKSDFADVAISEKIDEATLEFQRIKRMTNYPRIQEDNPFCWMFRSLGVFLQASKTMQPSHLDIEELEVPNILLLDTFNFKELLRDSNIEQGVPNVEPDVMEVDPVTEERQPLLESRDITSEKQDDDNTSAAMSPGMSNFLLNFELELDDDEEEEVEEETTPEPAKSPKILTASGRNVSNVSCIDLTLKSEYFNDGRTSPTALSPHILTSNTTQGKKLHQTQAAAPTECLLDFNLLDEDEEDDLFADMDLTSWIGDTAGAKDADLQSRGAQGKIEKSPPVRARKSQFSSVHEVASGTECEENENIVEELHSSKCEILHESVEDENDLQQQKSPHLEFQDENSLNEMKTMYAYKSPKCSPVLSSSSKPADYHSMEDDQLIDKEQFSDISNVQEKPPLSSIFNVSRSKPSKLSTKWSKSKANAVVPQSKSYVTKTTNVKITNENSASSAVPKILEPCKSNTESLEKGKMKTEICHSIDLEEAILISSDSSDDNEAVVVVTRRAKVVIISDEEEEIPKPQPRPAVAKVASQEDCPSPKKIVTNNSRAPSDSDSDHFVTVKRKNLETPNRRKKKAKTTKEAKNQFLESQAAVSGSESFDDDLDDSRLDEFDASFINNQTQADIQVDMKAKYLQSVKSPVGLLGRFKIPALLPTKRVMVSPGTDMDDTYLNDSFCVDSAESANESSECELERAEAALAALRRRPRQATNVPPSDSKDKETTSKKRQRSNSSTPKSVVENMLGKEKKKRRRVVVLNDLSSDEEESEVRSNVVEHPTVSTVSAFVPKSSTPKRLLVSGFEDDYLPDDMDLEAVIASLPLCEPPEPTSSSSVSENVLRKPPLQRTLFQEQFGGSKDDKSSSVSSMKQPSSGPSSSGKEDAIITSKLHRDPSLSRSALLCSLASKGMNMSTHQTAFSRQNIGEPRSSSFNAASNKPTSMTRATFHQPISNSCNFTIIASTRQVTSAARVLTVLPSVHKTNVLVKTLPVGVDFVISQRLAIGRYLISDVTSSNATSDLANGVRSMLQYFKFVVVVLENNAALPLPSAPSSGRAPAVGCNQGLTSKSLRTALCHLQRAKIKVAFSHSQDETASILQGLVEKESKSIFGISNICNEPNLDYKLKFFSTLPGVNIATALKLLQQHPNISQFIRRCSSVEEVERHIGVDRRQAIAILRVLNQVLS